MRTLTFAPTDKRRYKIIHQTLVFSPTELSREELLPHGKMLELVKGIGVLDPRSLPTDENPDPVSIFNLDEDGGTIVLEEAQYTMLRRHFKATIPKFPKEWSMDVQATDQWLKYIKEEVAVSKPKLVEGEPEA
jgi:hypothetical protein